MQGSNKYPLNDGRVSAQANTSPQANARRADAKTATVTVASTVASPPGGATGIIPGNVGAGMVIGGSARNSTSLVKDLVSRGTGTTLSTSARMVTTMTTATAVKVSTTKGIVSSSSVATVTGTVGGVAKKTAA